MVSYDDMRSWVKCHDLVMNRIKVLNVISENRFEVAHRGCRWWCEFLGRRVTEWRAYDVRSVEDALCRLSGIYKVMWDARREGYLSFDMA